jgi:sulfate/thiosulfate-binding protein
MLLHADEIALLNVSYDPTRELFEDYNKLFQRTWLSQHQQEVTVRQSHGGSGKQARAIMEGLRADVVTLALGYDIDVIAEKSGAIPANWQSLLPHNSAPYTSTIVFLVRKGNPKNIHDWQDLIKTDVQVITPNPKTSGGARWNYLAAYHYAMQANNNDETKALAYMKDLFSHVPVLDAGARASTMTFAQRGIGDVLISWENEAFLAMEKLGKGQFEIVTPSSSILAEPTVAVVEKVAKKKGHEALAKAYLEGLYSKEAQEIIALHGFRPVDAEVAERYATKFPTLTMVTITEMGGWMAAQKKHFDDGGTFDQISIQTP